VIVHEHRIVIATDSEKPWVLAELRGGSFHASEDDPEALPNARLMATAPEMLAALEEILAITELGEDSDECFFGSDFEKPFTTVRKVIAKAKGEVIR
jgi:hypothetical protein